MSTAIASVALIVAVVALGLALATAYRVGRRGRMGDIEALPEDVLGLRQEVAALQAEAVGALKHLSVVRYDAFGDMGGHLSWSLAVLDDAGDGVVVTSIHGRSDSRTYTKSVAGWAGDQLLSPEEQEAVAQARRV